LQSPGEGDFEIINLKSAKGGDAAKTLDAAFNDGKGNSTRIRIIADPATNSLLVRGNPLDMLTVRSLVEQTIDVDASDSKALTKVHRIGPLQSARASDVAWTVKEIYREHLNSTLSALRNGATRDTYFGWGGLSLNTDASGKLRPVDLTITADEQANTVIVSCTEHVYREIKKLVDAVDKAAKKVPIGPRDGIDWSEKSAAQVSQALKTSRSHSSAEASGAVP
jgi:type II secretory pathway component GspD/PulD (secretin)